MTKIITDEMNFDFDVNTLYAGEMDFEGHCANDAGIRFKFDVEKIGEDIENYEGKVYLVEYDEDELERVNNIVSERNNIIEKLHVSKTLEELEENLENELEWNGEKDVEEDVEAIVKYNVFDKKTLLGKNNDGIYWNITAKLNNDGLAEIYIEFEGK